MTATATLTASPAAAATAAPKRAFKRRYSVARGNAIQATNMLAGSGLLATAAALDGPGLLRSILMLAGFVAVYMNCHAIAHYAAGRLVGLKFRGYGVRGTDHPEVYPPGIRGLMEAAPFYVTLSTKASREQAGRLAKALYFAAGETSTAVCSIAFAAAADAAGIPGGHTLLLAMLGLNLISTIVTARTPHGDYAKAIKALRG
jgi:hypothetical protein